MMSFIDSLSTATELSTLKTWVVRAALFYIGTVGGTLCETCCEQGYVASCPRCVVSAGVEKG